MTSPESAEAATIDAARLTDAERSVLDLLAKGHTAKSIASLTGHSEGAVNERLRDARRKTGIGSSRELARLLLAQKTRDEKIGVEALVRPQTFEPAQAVPSRAATPTRKGRIIMAGFALAAVVAVSLLQTSWQPEAEIARQSPPASAGSSAAGTQDEAPEALPPAGLDPRLLRAQFLSQPRDERWASVTETGLDHAYRQIVDIGGAANPLTVKCAFTVCEVKGLSSRSTKFNDDGLVMQELQDA